MADSLRDPRAFKVLGGAISFPRDDDVLAARLKGDQVTDYAEERYQTGAVIPAGRLPVTAVGVFLGRGEVEVVEAAARGAGGATGANVAGRGRPGGGGGAAAPAAPAPVPAAKATGGEA